MTVDSFKHKEDKRVLIPSKEEAGSEQVNPVVQGKARTDIPLNPVTTRGQDPELYWMHKYGPDDTEDRLNVDIRSLYRHEHVTPEHLIKGLYRMVKTEAVENQPDLFELFGNPSPIDEPDKPYEYYKHPEDWTNRIIQGDSLLVMTSLLEREGLAGKVQMIYIDPPYGIKYGSNWQIRLNDRNIKDGSDEHLSGEPEQIKAFRDTWELGIHSYLSYLRDRLLVAKDLLTESGSCFVQISDENVHLVRCLMDEVFGSENFISLITVQKTAGQTAKYLSGTVDYIIWYAKKIDSLKYRQLFLDKEVGGTGGSMYQFVELEDKSRRRLTASEQNDLSLLSVGAKIFRLGDITSQRQGRPSGLGTAMYYPVEVIGKQFYPPGSRGWSTTEGGMKNLLKANRIVAQGERLSFVRYMQDFPVFAITNNWPDTGGATDRVYVVQTTDKVIARCILMTTDPGDLVLDPTCGSGTTAYVAEQWGRRWITLDTSRIALNIAKTRLMTANFPYYTLYDQAQGDLRQGFIYKKVPHITLGALANDEPPEEETLFDQPKIDPKKLRVAGPFTVETLQAFDPVSPESLDEEATTRENPERFEQRIFEHLKSAGIKNGARNEQAVFVRVERLGSAYLHAEGFYPSKDGERKAYLHIGPQFGTVSKPAVNEAIKECRARGDADWLVILGFSFESDIQSQSVTKSMGSFEVTKARMHDDLLQEGLLKKDKKAASFVTIGEPDIGLIDHGDTVQIEIRGLDIYNPIKDDVKARSVADIAYWMLDDHYDGSSFIVRQVFFCGSDEKDEFNKWKSGLSELAKRKTKRKVEQTLKIEIDDEAFDRLYGFQSHPIPKQPGRKIAVRVISQFGEESTKVLTL
ncbi:MAG: site-specific DNA-methyltransferase [Candidatus Methylumidiphilus sp.]